MSNKNKYFILASVILFSFTLYGQTSKTDSIWKPFNCFIGKWEGTGVVNGKKGNYERAYHFVLDKNFVEVKNKSTFEPTNENATSEVHEDFGYISYDKLRKTFVLRQFHIEGFVNQYKLENISIDGKTIVFISEAIENIQPGWRARETYQFNSDREFTETFSLAAPGKSFETYSQATFRKSAWSDISWLMGDWTGEGGGKPGQGGGTFSFNMDLNKNIVVRKSHSEYTAQQNIQPVVHDDLMIISLNNEKKPAKAVYYDNEGHTIQYQVRCSDKTVVFDSDKNAEAPFFRLVYEYIDPETILTRFEVSMNGKDFSTYVEGKSKKVHSGSLK